MTTFARKVERFCRRVQHSEESPDWKGHPAVESTDRGNLMNAATENKPPARVRVKQGGKSSQRRVATYVDGGTRTSKAKYTGRVKASAAD